MATSIGRPGGDRAENERSTPKAIEKDDRRDEGHDANYERPTPNKPEEQSRRPTMDPLDLPIQPEPKERIDRETRHKMEGNTDYSKNARKNRSRTSDFDSMREHSRQAYHRRQSLWRMREALEYGRREQQKLEELRKVMEDNYPGRRLDFLPCYIPIQLLLKTEPTARRGQLRSLDRSPLPTIL